MKIYWYTVLASVLMVFFNIAGLDTTSSFVATKLDLFNAQNFQSSFFWVKIISLFGAVAVGAAIIGSFTRTSPQWILKSTIIMPTIILLALDFFWILNQLNGWVYWIVATIMLPLIAGFAIAILEFWEGRD